MTQKPFWTTQNVVEIDRCCKSCFTNGLIIGLESGRNDAEMFLRRSETFLRGFDHGLGNAEDGRNPWESFLRDLENVRRGSEDLLVRPEDVLRDAEHLHDVRDRGRGLKENGFLRVGHGPNCQAACDRHNSSMRLSIDRPIWAMRGNPENWDCRLTAMFLFINPLQDDRRAAPMPDFTHPGTFRGNYKPVIVLNQAE
jgi:hypothetical protein